MNDNSPARRWALAIVCAALASLTCLALAAPALATPKGRFAVFSDCPLNNPEVTACVFSQTKSGEFRVGNSEEPINQTITLQGGIIETENPETEVITEKFVAAKDGNTLSKTPLAVRGGLLGLIPPEALPPFLRVLFEEFVNKGITGVTATAELAAPASSIGINEANLLNERGTALSLPVKVKLSNLFLGEKCYVGSNAHPIVLNLTTGTTSPPPPNKPIKGSAGKIRVEEGLLTDEGASLVDNSFSAPAAEGCGGVFAFLVDPVLDAKVGLPAAAGHNTAILTGQLQQAGAQTVRESE